METVITIEEDTQLIGTANAFYINKRSIDSKTVDVVFGPKTKAGIEFLIKENELPLMLNVDGWFAADTGKGIKFIVNKFSIDRSSQMCLLCGKVNAECEMDSQGDDKYEWLKVHW